MPPTPADPKQQMKQLVQLLETTRQNATDPQETGALLDCIGILKHAIGEEREKQTDAF